MEWLETQFIYNVTTGALDSAIGQLFVLAARLLDIFSLPLHAAAAIYIALMGYSLMSGMIAMPARDVAVRFAKVIGILLLIDVFRRYGSDVFNLIWAVPDGLADFFAEQLAPILGFTSAAGIDTLDALAGAYTVLAAGVGSGVTEAHSEQAVWGIATWIVTMAPFALTVIAVYIAKFVSALLFLAAPLVFILSLTFGSFQGNNIMLSWFKAVLLTFLTVIFVYIAGIIGMTMIARYMGALLAFEATTDVAAALVGTFVPGGAELVDAAVGDRFTLIHLSPLVILGLFTIILLSQAATAAGALLGAAGINTQQATGFMQIGSLQAATRAG